MKEGRIKRFVKKHEKGLYEAAACAVVSTAIIGGFVLGTKYYEVAYTRGLNMCFCANPELKEILSETIKRVDEITS